ncbi:hypothetical protein [Paraburkholderia sediminicola]|uniref:hypothetical protein n=1 Tax=Paraburkholderia sediminicola TaxID=458836 RepID=UPI0038B9AA8B
MKALRIGGYSGLAAIALTLLVTMCVILQDSVIASRIQQQPLVGSALNSASESVAVSKVSLPQKTNPLLMR